MEERTITIPYEEYKELKSVQDVMSSEGDIVYVRDDTYSSCNHYVISAVHTKDYYVKQLLRELKGRNERIKEDQVIIDKSEDKVHPYWRSAAIILGSTLISYFVLQFLFL